MLTDVNIAAIITSAVIYMALSALWYSPKLFGRQWLNLSGLHEEDLKENTQAYFGGFVIALLISYVLSLFINKIKAITAIEGAAAGFLAWLGFIATTHFSGVLWEKRPMALYLIHVGNLLIVLIIAGALLAVWR